MILSEKNEIIFIHVPKCAGTSVKTLLQQCGFRKTLLDLAVEDVETGFFRLGTAARMRRDVDPDFWQRSVKFAVCRNPYDRLVSAWSFCRAGGHLDAPFDYFVRNMASFRAYWIEWHCTMPQLQHLLVDGVPAVKRQSPVVRVASWRRRCVDVGGRSTRYAPSSPNTPVSLQRVSCA